MKTLNALICIAIVVVMTNRAMASTGTVKWFNIRMSFPETADAGDDLFVHHSGNVADGESFLLLDYCIDKDDYEWVLCCDWANGDMGWICLGGLWPLDETQSTAGFNPDGGREFIKIGNANQHQDDSQNVLFLDSHVGFSKEPYVGVNDDNIYTFWDGGDIRIGAQPVSGASTPQDRTDSLLVHDGDLGSAPAHTPKGRACFVAETPAMVDGKLVQIQKVAASGMTLQEHEGTYTCRDIVLETGNKISVVEGHCFMTDAGQWVNAQNLTTSLRLKTLKGNVGIKSITTRSYTGKVYNLKVDGSDQYMVGKDSVIVRDY